MPGTMPTDTPDRTVQDTEPNRTAPLSAVEAARLTGVHEKTVRRAIKAGELAAGKVKGSYRIDPAALTAWQATQAQSDNRTNTGQDSTVHTESGPADGVRSPNGTGSDLVAYMTDEIRYLREQLARRDDHIDQISRDQAAERERFDIIHREALNRIEALTAGPVADAPAPSPGGPGRDESPMTPDDLLEAFSDVQAAPTVPPALSQEWADLTDQLIAELGMDPEAALMAAADELGIEYG